MALAQLAPQALEEELVRLVRLVRRALVGLQARRRLLRAEAVLAVPALLALLAAAAEQRRARPLQPQCDVATCLRVSAMLLRNQHRNCLLAAQIACWRAQTAMLRYSRTLLVDR